MNVLWRGGLWWMALAGAEMLHGTARALWLVPRVGDLASRQIGVFTGSAIVLAVAWIAAPRIGARTAAQQWQVGLMWLVLMVAFEVGLGRALGLSWERLASDYDPRQGGLMLFGLAVLAVAPRWAGRRRAHRARVATLEQS